ncbi:MAG: hypothetical protein AAF311_14310, partial [Pseudomonadota bacterium]
ANVREMTSWLSAEVYHSAGEPIDTPVDASAKAITVARRRARARLGFLPRVFIDIHETDARRLVALGYLDSEAIEDRDALERAGQDFWRASINKSFSHK